MHSSHPDNHHVTVFMTSQPSDPRPDPFVEGGGFVHGVSVIAAPKPAVMAKEIETYQALAAAVPPPVLEVSQQVGQQVRSVHPVQLTAALHERGVCPHLVMSSTHI